MTALATQRGPIGVMVVDDHRVLRSGLRLLVDREPDMRFLAEAATAEEAITLSSRVAPDVIVLDIEMPGIGGLAAMAELRRRLPGVRIVMLSMHASASDVQRAFAAGADGYVTKSAAGNELVGAIRAAVEGRGYLDPALGAAMATPVRDPLAGLTEREREVMRLLALGHGNQEIAGMLHLSPRTVETHRANVMGKLGIDSRAELVQAALQAGLLTPDAASS
jgi:DNA-binding NarL/FixJ family response regulator